MLASLRPTTRRLFLVSIGVFASGLLAVAAYLLLREEAPSEPEGRIAFSAGGSIYVINADGSSLTRVVEGERKDGIWASAPAFSPDGDRIAFARDLDIWIVDADGDNVDRLDVAEYQPSPGASNWTVGVTNVSWSSDGEELLFGTARIGGSGLGYFGRINVDGSGQKALMKWGAGFLLPWWLPDGHIAFAGNKEQIVVLDSIGEAVTQADFLQPSEGAFRRIEVPGADWPAVIDVDPDGRWLAGAFINEGPIVYGRPGAMREVASGVSPELSPDGGWIAYSKGDIIHLVRTDGSDDHELLNLAPLGGRDRHFASQPECYPDNSAACSYRPPVLSWTDAEG